MRQVTLWRFTERRTWERLTCSELTARMIVKHAREPETFKIGDLDNVVTTDR